MAAFHKEEWQSDNTEHDKTDEDYPLTSSKFQAPSHLPPTTILNYAALPPKQQFRMLICRFSIKSSLFKADSCFGKTRNAIILLKNLLESLFPQILEIALLPASVCTASTLQAKNSPIMAPKRES